MSDFKWLLEKALAFHREGKFELALTLYERVLDSNPDHWETLYLHGTALLQLQRFSQSIGSLEKAAAGRPDFSDAANHLGLAYQALGRWEEAEQAFLSAVRAQPDDAQSHLNLAVLQENRGNCGHAETAYRHVLLLRPTDSNALFRLGNLLKTQSRFPEAEACYREILQQDADSLDALVNLGVVLVQQDRLPEAEKIFRDVLDQRPGYAEIWGNLSYVLERRGKLNEAVETARQAVRLRPDYSEGWNNLGIALRSMHKIDDAIQSFQDALKRAPGFALAAFNRATTFLLAGRYREGWPDYARHAETIGTGLRKFTQPGWNGEPLLGKTLLIYADQGLGDTIQFVRFLSRAKERSQARVILECQPQLQALLANCAGVDVAIAAGEPLPAFDAVTSLVQLPAILDADLESIRVERPYLQTPNELRPNLREFISQMPKETLKVGLVWQGNPRQARDIVRSCPLQKFLPLFGLAGVSFVSLQTEPTGRAQLRDKFPAGLPSNLFDAGGMLVDFCDTASVMAKLDLILTVDTSTAHLAGALGCPTWTMLCHTPDWRWHLERTDSPWYPTMRLFRQPRWGDWEAVVAEISRELASLVLRHRGTGLQRPHTPVGMHLGNSPRTRSSRQEDSV